MASWCRRWWCPVVVVLILSSSAGGWYAFYRHLTTYDAFDPRAVATMEPQPVRWKGEVVEGGRIRVHEGDGRVYLVEPDPNPDVPLVPGTEVYFEGVFARAWVDQEAGGGVPGPESHVLEVEDFHLRHVRTLAPPPPRPPLVIGIVAQKFRWSFVYPDGSPRSELHLPSDGPVEFTVTSTDVVHCPQAPGMPLPEALPGVTGRACIDGHRVPGTYQLVCEEYCGAGHSRMKARVVVESPEAFEAWLKGAPY